MNRPDFSNLVGHFTKDGAPCAESEGSSKEELGTAYDRLVSILGEKRVRASAMPWTGCHAVAFTECPFASLLDHAERYSPYGIGFTKAHLFAAAGGPAIYLRPDLFERQKTYCHPDHPDWRGFDSAVYAFVTPFMPAYAPAGQKEKWGKPLADYTHEREWRVPHDFTFELDEVQFVMLDSYEDMARFPREFKDAIGRDNFVIMDVYRKIESLWPTHRID